MSAADLNAQDDGFAGPYICICQAVDDLCDHRKDRYALN